MSDDYSVSWKKLTWNDIAVCGPVLVTIFAFSYVVGYFYASDISWFPFFSLSEHLVFAIRALPIATVAVAIALVGVRISETYRDKGIIRIIFAIVWIIILLYFAVEMIVYNHIGLAFSFMSVAVGVGYFTRKRQDMPLLVHIIYWGVNLTVVCILVGYLSGSTWQCHESFSKAYPIYIDHKNGKDAPYGHILFSGGAGILLYDYGLKRVRLVRPNMDGDLYECKTSNCDDINSAPTGPQITPPDSTSKGSPPSAPAWCGMFSLPDDLRRSTSRFFRVATKGGG
jgi:hypothetical protein